MPFRHPDRGEDLPTRIDAEVRERLEEAIDYVCLQAQVQARREQNLPPPAADSDRDRQEFTARVGAFLRLLHEQIPAGVAQDARLRPPAVEPGDQAGLIAAQVFLARTLPDYWQRFEAVSARYLASPADSGGERPRLLARLFGRG
jgi:hypothetical protein